MLTRTTRLGTAALIASTVLALSACGGTERCSGSNHEMTCTVTKDSASNKWGTEITGDRAHSEIVLSGTISVETGSGTVSFLGEDRDEHFELTAGEPLEITDLTMELHDAFGPDEDEEAYLTLQVEPDPGTTLEGFTAEYDYVTR